MITKLQEIINYKKEEFSHRKNQITDFELNSMIDKQKKPRGKNVQYKITDLQPTMSVYKYVDFSVRLASLVKQPCVHHFQQL